MPVRKLTDFIKQVHDDSQGKVDFTETASNLRMDTLGRLITKTDEGATFKLDFNDWGLGQALGRVNAPGLRQYGKHLQEIGETYKLSNLFNFHLEKTVEEDGDREWLVRTKGNTCRACLSNRYGIIDNEHIAHNLYERFKDSNIDVVGSGLSDNYMNIRLILNDLQLNAGTLEKRDNLHFGIHCINSEVGASSVIIYPMIFRLICTNGMIAVKHKGNVFKQRHTISSEDTQSAIDEKISSILEEGKEQMELFAGARERKVKEPERVIENIVNHERLPVSLTERVVNSYLEEPEPTEYGVLNAFTRTARNLNFEDRVELERLAGNLLLKGNLQT